MYATDAAVENKKERMKTRLVSNYRHFFSCNVRWTVSIGNARKKKKRDKGANDIRINAINSRATNAIFAINVREVNAHVTMARVRERI